LHIRSTLLSAMLSSDNRPRFSNPDILVIWFAEHFVKAIISAHTTMFIVYMYIYTKWVVCMHVLNRKCIGITSATLDHETKPFKNNNVNLIKGLGMCITPLTW